MGDYARRIAKVVCCDQLIPHPALITMKTETIGLAGYYKTLVPEKWPKTGKNTCITDQPLLNLIIMKRREVLSFLTHVL